jgi:Ulp1 family protease
LEKTKRPLEDDWKTESISGKIPQQQNTNGWSLKAASCFYQIHHSDCGVFSCIFAEYIARDAAFNFSQADMPKIRNLVKYELLKGKMLRE